MRFFFLQDLQHWLMATILGLILVILIYLGLTAYEDASARSDTRAEEEFHYPDGIEGRNFPVPTFILFLFLGFVIWAIFYVIFVGLKGPI